jgi:uncharacterized membrane protein YcjF (UPF0283 family)
MPENPNSPKNKFKTALIVVALTFGLCFIKVVTSKLIWGVWGHQSWDTWKFEMISWLIMVIVILVAVYCRHGRGK